VTDWLVYPTSAETPRCMLQLEIPITPWVIAHSMVKKKNSGDVWRLVKQPYGVNRAGQAKPASASEPESRDED